MKIYNSSINPAHVSQDSSSGRNQVLDKEEFGRLLDTEISGVPDVDRITNLPQGIDPMVMLNAAAQIQATQTSQIAEDQSIDGISSILNELDSLGDHLASSSASPKQIQDQWNTIQSGIENLTPSLDMLPADHPLKGVGEELGILAYVESTKWNRGDYL